MGERVKRDKVTDEELLRLLKEAEAVGKTAETAMLRHLRDGGTAVSRKRIRSVLAGAK